MTNESPRDLYVGYLPTPPGHRRFLLVVVPVLLIGMLVLAGAMAMAQRDPGPTPTLTPTDADGWTGTAFSAPYPLIVADDGRTYLIVGLGKFGVADRVAPFDGQRCVVRGIGQTRAGRHVIQLDTADDAIAASTGSPLPSPPVTDGSPMVLNGEIVDGKCYTGAMKPGSGKAHKACAILCIQGGIPAFIASADLAADDALPLLRVDGSTELPSRVLRLVGEAVTLRGTLSRAGNLTVFDIRAADVERWAGSDASP